VKHLRSKRSERNHAQRQRKVRRFARKAPVPARLRSYQKIAECTDFAREYQRSAVTQVEEQYLRPGRMLGAREDAARQGTPRIKSQESTPFIIMDWGMRPSSYAVAGRRNVYGSSKDFCEPIRDSPPEQSPDCTCERDGS